MFKIIPLFFALMLTSHTHGQEISQWRGPNRDGIYPETGLLKEWPAEGPSLVLKIEGVGRGLSQPIVYQDHIYITGIKADSMDVISAFDFNGRLIWEQPFSRAWDRTYPESRGTPTIENNKIFLIGGMGEFVCIDTQDGHIIWKQEPHKKFKGEIMHWGIVESVLLSQDAALYITAGKETTIVAYAKDSGKLLWKSASLGGKKSYASSSLIERNGIPIALIQTSEDLIGLDVRDGSILWSSNTSQYHFDKGKGEAANTPLYHDGEIFVTYGNQQPGLMYSLSEDGMGLDLKWKNEVLDTHFGGLVQVDGVIYGSTMLDNSKGFWAAVDWDTGETLWEDDWNNKGSIISADGLLYLYEERKGHVALAQPDKTELKIISTFQIQDGTGPHWAHPSIFKGMLLIRHGAVLLGYDIADE